jgi:hypothetical protein
MSSPIQDFWCSPPPGITTMVLGALDGIQVFSDRSEAEICEACMTRFIHKYIQLDMHQCDGETGLRKTTHPLEIPMNDIAGVKVTEALGYVG